MKLRAFITVSILVVGSAFTSCYYTKPDPGKAVIVVLDENDFRVPAASVVLHQEGQQGDGIIYASGFTDIEGVFEYIHEPALEIIAFVDASLDTCAGKGTVRIIPNEVTYDTVHIFC